VGLDQYLSKRFYLKNWEHTPAESRHEVIILRGGDVRKDIPIQNITEVVCDVMYWRKANAIHKWFVDNCQDGVDDCKEYYVSMEQLKELYQVCCKVLKASKLIKGKIENGYDINSDGTKNPIMEDGEYIEDSSVAKELLPTTEGFFFGGKAYDEWYYRDVKDTKNIVRKELAIRNNEASYYYHASW
jgi:hypothetical protein